MKPQQLRGLCQQPTARSPQPAARNTIMSQDVAFTHPLVRVKDQNQSSAIQNVSFLVEWLVYYRRMSSWQGPSACLQWGQSTTIGYG